MPVVADDFGEALYQRPGLVRDHSPVPVEAIYAEDDLAENIKL
jgi:hypothetical protein